MKITSAIIFILALLITTACGQTVDSIVREIAEINEVQSESIGIAGEPSENYRNFEKLKEKADIPTLIELTENESPVVSCYAGWALIDKEYADSATIFSRYLNSDKSVTTLNACAVPENNLSSEFYHRFWNNVTDKRANTTLIQLNSLIIYQVT